MGPIRRDETVSSSMYGCGKLFKFLQLDQVCCMTSLPNRVTPLLPVVGEAIVAGRKLVYVVGCGHKQR